MDNSVHATNVTVFPAGVHTASTWDKDLMYQRGLALGVEGKSAGVHVQLAPVGGPLGRNAMGGRNWEGFSADPYLTGVAFATTVEAMQAGGVQACAKHYLLNEQETNRTAVSSNADDRTVHELYLWPFADAVKANVASVMCSYNLVNDTHACESEHVLTELLKNELDFKGFVVSDWGAQATTDGSANGGLDMAQPFSDLWSNNLIASIAR
jgi:beta-glucosidase